MVLLTDKLACSSSLDACGRVPGNRVHSPQRAGLSSPPAAVGAFLLLRVLSRTPNDIKRSPYRRGIHCGALTDKPAQRVLGTGTRTNRLSTFEAATARYSGPGNRRALEMQNL